MPTVAGDLGIAIRVISAVNKDVVGNLTKIAESACPTCANITEVIKESVQVIEQTLEKIDPDWQKNPIWKVMSHFTLVQRNERISPSFARVHSCRACTQANLARPAQATFHSLKCSSFCICLLHVDSLVPLTLSHTRAHARTHAHTHTHTHTHTHRSSLRSSKRFSASSTTFAHHQRPVFQLPRPLSTCAEARNNARS
jgi:hypothetical protein